MNGEDLAPHVDFDRVYRLAKAAMADLPADELEARREAAEFIGDSFGSGDARLVFSSALSWTVEWPDGRFLCTVDPAQVMT